MAAATKYRADYLICAIPFTVLRSVHVAPAFSAAKQSAIGGLSYQSISRVFLETKTRFWNAERAFRLCGYRSAGDDRVGLLGGRTR